MDRKKTSRDYKKRKKEIRRNRIFFIFFVFSVVFLVTNLVSLGSERKREEKFVNLIGTAENYGKDDGEDNKDDPIVNSNNNIGSEYIKSDNKEGWIANITKAVQYNDNAQLVLDNVEELPEDLLRMAGSNFDTIDFVAKYIDNTIKFNFKYPSKIHKNVKAPYYIQWDQKWGYQEYGTGIIGNAGCAPTSLAMMLSGITGKNIKPNEIADLATENGHVGDYGTNWDLYPFIAEEFNLSVRTIMSDGNAIRKELDKGNSVLISVGPGTFTTISHIMLVVGYDDNGYFKIHDPNSLQNTEKTWDYEAFKGEVKNIWSYSK